MPELLDTFQPYFRASAVAAAKQCTGTVAGLTGNACGFKWANEGNSPVGTWDGTYGFGQQMDALETIGANLIGQSGAPVTHVEGITHGDPSAGTEGDNAVTTPKEWGPITTASTAGASILTAFLVIAWCGAIWWMII